MPSYIKRLSKSLLITTGLIRAIPLGLCFPRPVIMVSCLPLFPPIGFFKFDI